MCTVSAKGCLSSWSPVHSIHSIEPCHLTSPSHGCDAEWGTDSGKVEQNVSVKTKVNTHKSNQ
ncbi:hypothetical protein Bca52824_088979 [Brassica carinata]|uniref:Uncharacterized protein n=1 Tax=Brassica carinata TaxID=52824 RepID=A0A8X7TRB8_BRACI|nr:hypothetical protein Bca52824_088979 [Brassica carinata]